MAVNHVTRRVELDSGLCSIRSARFSSGLISSILLFSLGVLLIVASILKSLALWRSEVPPAFLFLPDSTRGIVVAVEALLGVWWISGVAQAKARRVAIGVFLLLAGFAGLAAWHGAPNCGCFGSAGPKPVVLLLFDLAMVGLLWGVGTEAGVLEDDGVPFGAAATLLRLTAAGFLAAGIVTLTDEGYTDHRLLNGSEVVSNVIGKRLEDLGKVDIAEKLRRGEWLVVFWDHDCPKCVTELPRVISLAEKLKASESRSGVALVEVPPYSRHRPTNHPPLILGRISSATPWLVRTPFWIELRDGVIVRQSLKMEDLVKRGDLQ